MAKDAARGKLIASGKRSTKNLGFKVNQENVVATATRASYDYAVNMLTQRSKVVNGGTAFGAAPIIDWGYYGSQSGLVSGREPEGKLNDLATIPG